MAKKKPKNKIKHKKKEKGERKKKKMKDRSFKNSAAVRRSVRIAAQAVAGDNKKKAKKENIANGVHKTKVRVIGIGGGGGSIVSEIISRIKKADFVAANTDARALKIIKKARHFQFGKDLTQGLGTGMNVEIGETAAQNEKERIKKLFEGQDVCIIISCLGGGTGCGATPVFAKIAKNSNCLTYGIFTLPFEFEGEKKMEIAKEALLKIKPYLNIYSVIPNERIFKIIDKNTPLRSALSAINTQLAENLEGLIEMIYLPGLINIDFADLKTILSGRGRLAYLKKVEIQEPEKEEAAKKLISSRLYPYTIQGARAILYNITGGKNLQLSDVAKISEIISSSLNKKAKIIFGISQRPQKQTKIDLSVLAVGCSLKGDLLKPKHLLKEKGIKNSSGYSQPIPAKPKKSSRKGSQRIKRGKKTTILPGKETLKKKKNPSLNIPSKTETVKSLKPESKKTKAKKEKKIALSANKPNKPESKKTKRPKALLPKTETREKPILPVEIEKNQINKKTEQGLLIVKEPVSPDKFYSDENQTIRRNALQVKKVTEEEEKKIIEKEKIWETPAIFRRKKNKNNNL